MTSADRRGIVTPEAVPLEFEHAGVGSRCIAMLLDLVIQYSVLFVMTVAGVLIATQSGWGMPPWLAVTALVLLGFLVVWGYPVAFETLWRGRTPGKAAMGLRVVTVEGAPVQARHAAIRAALTVIDLYLTLGGIAVVTILLTPRSQRLGDLVAGTLVLRERTGAEPPTAAHFDVPAGAEAYAATVDPAGMREEDYATVRSFLLRAAALDQAVRDDLARRLAVALAARLAHRVPPGVSPELFLACAAARYQQRSRPASPGGDALPEAPPSPPSAPPPAAGDTAEAAPAPDGGFAPPG